MKNVRLGLGPSLLHSDTASSALGKCGIVGNVSLFIGCGRLQTLEMAPKRIFKRIMEKDEDKIKECL